GIVFKLARAEGVWPRAEKRNRWIVWTQHQLPFFDGGVDRESHGGNRLKKSRASFFHPVVASGVVTSLSGRDDFPCLEPDSQKRMGMPESQPEHTAILMQNHAFANTPRMADRAVGAHILKAKVGGMVGTGQQEKISAPTIADVHERHVLRGPGIQAVEIFR